VGRKKRGPASGFPVQSKGFIRKEITPFSVRCRCGNHPARQQPQCKRRETRAGADGGRSVAARPVRGIAIGAIALHGAVEIGKLLAALRPEGPPGAGDRGNAVDAEGPEIAAQLGIEGSHLFKLGGKYQFIRLDEFVSESYRIYHDHPRIGIRPEFARMLDKAVNVIKAAQ